MFDPETYHFEWISVPFIVATVAMLLVCIYPLFMKGSTARRWSMFALGSTCVPYFGASALIACSDDIASATTLYRLTTPFLGLSGAAVLVFDLALTEQLAKQRPLVMIAFLSSAAIGVVTATTDLVIVGAWVTPSGMIHYEAGVLFPLQFAMVAGWVPIGTLNLIKASRVEPSPLRRRQYRAAILAYSIASIGLVDAALAYKLGWVPVSWLGITLSGLINFRSLLVDDLIHATSVDRRAPKAMLYGAAGFAAAYLYFYAVPATSSWWELAAGAFAIFVALRLASAAHTSLRAPKTKQETPLVRMQRQFADKLTKILEPTDMEEATREHVRVAIGCEVRLLCPSREDYSWHAPDGAPIPPQQVPHPLLQSWLIENKELVLRDELQSSRLGELRAPLEDLFNGHDAYGLISLANRDEPLGLLIIAGLADDRALRRDELDFLRELARQLTSALLYARMNNEATRRVEINKEVELAAAVQAAFVPGNEVMRVGAVEVCGAYVPASQCGGDWWSAHKLPGGATLILIGDVTGHGVAAAMITAAARGCYDVVQRLAGDKLDLVRLLELLDSSVRRAGANRFHMTCFATILDPATKTATFANAGHVVPYLCRTKESGKIDLQALVARGNPLGAGPSPSYRSHTRAIEEGDLLVWYTDGLVESPNPEGQQYGDRRMQKLLRGIDLAKEGARDVRDQLTTSVSAFQDGTPPPDDITLVVAKVRAA